MERPTDEESIFIAASDCPDLSQRAAYLDHACAGDVALRHRLELLLSAYGQGHFLELPAAGSAATAAIPPVSEKPGVVIGPYKLLEQIGEGGMGLVFMAEQSQPLRRRVALKIIKPGMDTRAVVARFEAERQALALMDHPNIARVYDAGATESGRPYFVMELVRGVPITDYCVERELNLRSRLELFIEVCQAVQHAHQKGIIHRDLKPTNILVAHDDTTPVPKVIDFGVAKATTQQLTERTLFTAFAQIIGTPLYMSPEQAELNYQDVDTRSDVYSLGVVLYELLTGTTPFDAERMRSVGPDEMRRIIREEEPPKPSTRATTVAAATTVVAPHKDGRQRLASLALRGDLDWIVMKALEKDRRRRYESVGAFAADVLRYLNNEPVEAYPPSRRYRLAKLVRRNRAGLLMTAVVVVVLLAGSGISVWQAVRATRAEQSKDVALQQARRAVDDMYTGVAEKWLDDQGSLTAVQRELLEKALAFYESFSAELGAGPEVEYEALRSLYRVGSIRKRLGNNADAEKAFLRAVDESTRLIQKYPERPEFRVELMDSRTELAQIYRTIGRVEDANTEAVLAQSEVAKLGGATIRDPQLRQRLATTLTALSRELTIANRVEQAEAAIQLALDSWRSLVADDPAEFDYRYGLAHAQQQLGLRQMWWESTDGKAEASLREADVLLTELLKKRPHDVACRRTLSVALTNLGVVLAGKKRFAEAVEINRRNLSLSEGLAQEFPNDAKDQESYLICLTNLAASLADAQTGESEEELRLYTTAHAVAEELVDRYPDSVRHKTAYLRTLIDVSKRLYGQGQREEAQRLHLRASPRLDDFVAMRAGAHEISSLICICQTIRAAIFIDFADHARAADALNSYGLTTFQPGVPNPYAIDSLEFESHIVSNYDAQSLLLMTPAALLDECISLAQQDMTLSPNERSQAIESYSAQAASFRKEGELAIDPWVEALASGRSDGFVAGHHGENRIRSIQESQGNTRIPPCLRNAYVATDRLMFQKLVNEAATQLSEEPSQHYVAHLLAAAPSELRDNDLALKLARRAVELAPDDEARQALGWALFRAEQWQGCVDTLATVTMGKKDGPQSVLTMALWQLGRRDEAHRLFETAEERLEDFKKISTEREGRGVVTFPSLSMHQRLHSEAGAMLMPPAAAP